MIEFGKTLRLAREAKGCTIAQLAETTRLAPSLIVDLENEEFGQIAAPIYGRGFVKLYCEAVGIDPKPLVAEFMEILNGNREPHIKERPVVETPPRAHAAPEPPDDSEPIQEPPPQPDLFRSLQQPAPAPDAPGLPEPPPPPVPPADGRPMLSRYAAPFRAMRSAPPAVWRLGSLSIAAAVILVLVFFGIRALYRATSSAPAPEAPEAAERAPAEMAEKDEKTETAAAPADETAAAPRTPLSIPPLYID